MRKKKVLAVALAAMVAGVALTSCGASKQAAQAQAQAPQQVAVTDPNAMKSSFNEEAEVELVTPCSGEGFYSTKELIRSTGIGESMDQQMSKRMSRQAALEDMGTKIRVAVNALISDYYKSSKQDMTEDLKQRIVGRTDLVVKEHISHYRSICEKFTRKGSNYKCYLAIEIGVDEMSKPIHQKLTDDQTLRIDYEYEKFKEQFNEAMRQADSNR